MKKKFPFCGIELKVWDCGFYEEQKKYELEWHNWIMKDTGMNGHVMCSNFGVFLIELINKYFAEIIYANMLQMWRYKVLSPL